MNQPTQIDVLVKTSVGTIYRPLAAAAVHSSWGHQGTGYRVLPLVAGAASAIPSSIGDQGDVVGTSFGPEGALLGGFWWNSANGVRDLGSLIRSVDAQGNSYAIAAVIGNNSQGQVLVQVRSGLSEKPRMARLDPIEK